MLDPERRAVARARIVDLRAEAEHYAALAASRVAQANAIARTWNLPATTLDIRSGTCQDVPIE